MIDDLGSALRLIRSVERDEDLLATIKKRLKDNYAVLVLICPHDEAVDRPSKLRGMGTTRRCKICGVTDYASEGGTPGDEYNYGYPGAPNRSFWKGAKVEVVDEKTFNSYSRSHDYRVQNGVVDK